MTEITIAGNFSVPDNLTLGDTLKIDGAKEPDYAPGQIRLETVARDPLTVTKPDDPLQILAHRETA